MRTFNRRRTAGSIVVPKAVRGSSHPNLCIAGWTCLFGRFGAGCSARFQSCPHRTRSRLCKAWRPRRQAFERGGGLGEGLVGFAVEELGFDVADHDVAVQLTGDFDEAVAFVSFDAFEGDFFFVEQTGKFGNGFYRRFQTTSNRRATRAAWRAGRVRPRSGFPVR